MRLRGCEAHFTTDLKQISVMWWCELTSFRLLWMSWTFNATVNSFKIKCIWLSMFPWHDSTFCPQSMQCVLFYRCRNYQCVTAMIQKSKKPIARLLNRDWRMIKKSFRPHPVTQKSSSTCRIQEGVNKMNDGWIPVSGCWYCPCSYAVVADEDYCIEQIQNVCRVKGQFHTIYQSTGICRVITP